MSKESIRLTQYSHGAGCGCKIAPDVLTRILAADCETKTTSLFPSLLVGNQSRDDAAAVALNDELALLSTTDFFMPIVDDPYDFGRIAATNAVSDIYAMGGQPVVAVAILGWPIAKLDADIANQVIRGGRDVCQQLGFPLELKPYTSGASPTAHVAGTLPFIDLPLPSPCVPGVLHDGEKRRRYLSMLRSPL